MADRELTVIGHLDELRRRIIIALVVLIGASAISLPFASTILAFLKLPARGALKRLVYFGPEEALVIYMRIGIITGAVISFPVIAYQVWAFTSPALGKGFKRYTIYFVSASVLAFASGCAFAYFALIPAALSFLLKIGRGELEPVISATRYISFVTGFIIACGAVFEMPVAAFFLGRTGIVTPHMMRKNFKYAFVVILIASAVITPTGDAFNMMLLAAPMLILYELSIWVVFFASKRRISDAG